VTLSNHSLPSAQLALHIGRQQVVLHEPCLLSCLLLCKRVARADVRSDASCELSALEGLCDVVIGTTSQALNNVGLFSFG
jgi:hypothetical protein